MSKPTKHYGKWRIRWIDEHGERQSAVLDEHKTALLVLRQNELEADERRRGLRDPPPTERTFDDIAEYWERERVPLKRSGDDDKSILKQLRAVFGKTKLVDYAGLIMTVDRYQAAKAHLNVKTVANHLTLLGSLLTLAHDLGWMPRVPKIKKPKVRLISQDYRYLRTNDEILRSFEDRVEHAYGSHVDADRVRIRRQEHSLRVELVGAQSVCVDVVPVRWDGNEQRVVLVPDRSTGTWRPTSIHRQRALLDEIDVVSRSVRRGIRLLKQWRTVHDLGLRSYAVEVLVLHAAYKSVPKHPRTLFVGVLEDMVRTQLRVPVFIPRYCKPPTIGRSAMHVFDPAVPSNNLTDEIDSRERTRIVSRARRTLEHLRRAEDALSRLGDLYELARHEPELEEASEWNGVEVCDGFDAERFELRDRLGWKLHGLQREAG